MKQAKRLLSVLLILLLALSLLPGSVLAAAGTGSDSRTVVTEIVGTSPVGVNIFDGNSSSYYAGIHAPEGAPWVTGISAKWEIQSSDGQWSPLPTGSRFSYTDLYRVTCEFWIRNEAAQAYRFSCDSDPSGPPTVTVNAREWTVLETVVTDEYSRCTAISPEIRPQCFGITAYQVWDQYGDLDAEFDGNYYPTLPLGDRYRYHLFVEALNGCHDTTFTLSGAVNGTRLYELDFSQAWVWISGEQTDPFIVSVHSASDPRKTGSLVIYPQPNPVATEVLCFFDPDDIRLSADMTTAQVESVIRRALSDTHDEYVRAGDQAVLMPTWSKLTDASFSPIGQRRLQAGETYYLQLFARPFFPYAVDADHPPVFRRAKGLEGGGYSVYGTSTGYASDYSSASGTYCWAYFPLTRPVTEKLWVEQADLNYDRVAARYTELMTGEEATAELRGRIGDAPAKAQAAAVAEECYVAKKVGGDYVDLSGSTEPIGAGDFYAVFSVKPENGNHWNLAAMLAGASGWPSVTAGGAAVESVRIVDQDDDAEGRVIFVQPLNVAAACPAPTSPSLSQIGTYGLKLNFRFVSPGQIAEGDPVPTCYRVERMEEGDEVSGTWQFVANYDYEPDGPGQTHGYTYVDTDLTAGRTYTFRVRSENEYGASEWITCAGMTVAWIAPSAISRDSVSVTQDKSTLTLTWGAADGAVSYTVYRAVSDTEPSGQWPRASDFDYTAAPVAEGLTEPVFTDTDVEIGKWYGYSIDAVNPGGSSRTGTMTTVRTKTQLVPPVVTGLTATADCGVVTVTWDPMPDAKQYHAESAPCSDPSEEDFNRFWTCLWYLGTDQLAPDATYTIRVCPEFEDGSYGGWAYVTITLPPLPDGSFECNVGNTNSSGYQGIYTGEPGIYLALSGPGCDGYVIYRNIDGGVFNMWIKTTDGGRTLLVDPDVLPGHSYRYRITSYNAAGECETPMFTDAVVCDPGRPTPAWMHAQALPGRVRLTWDPVEGADGYRLFYQNASGSLYWLTYSRITDTSFEVTEGNSLLNYLPGLEYAFAVYAEIGGKCGGYTISNTVTLLSADAQILEITRQPEDYVGPEGSTASFTVVAEGAEPLTYQWWIRNPGESEFTKSTRKTATYSTTLKAASNGRELYCVVTDANGNSVQTDTVTMSIAAPLTITQQPVNYVGAEGSTASFTVKAEGAEPLSYQWWIRNPGENEFTKSTRKTATYSTTLKAASNGRELYCVVTDATGNSVQTDTVTMSIEAALAITRQPVDYVGEEGSTASFTVVAQGAEPLTYQWWIRNPGENEFTKSTRRTATYSTTLKAASNGRELYCVVMDASGNSVTSDTVSMSIEAALAITRQPVDYVGAEGSTASFTVVAVGAEPLTYQWWIRNPGENEFTKSTRKTATYSTTLKAASSGRELYCVVTDASGNSVTSDTVTMTIEAGLAITRQPVDYVGAEGSTASFTVVAQGAEPLTYQWWIRNPGENEFTKSTRKTATYSTTLKAASNGRELYCVVTDASGNSVKSDTVTMTIAQALTITSQPVNYVGAEGSTASFTVVAKGEGLTYQWWIRNPGETEFTLSTRKTATYSTTLKAASNGRELYCVVTDASGNSVKSDTVTMTIAQALTITSQPVNYVGAEGSTATFTVVAKGEGLTYQWWIRNPGETEFTLSTRKTATYSTTLKAASNGRELYCVVTDAAGNSVTSVTVTMTIQ